MVRKRSKARVVKKETTSCTTQSVGLFACPICRSILQGPVTGMCGHSFCTDCLVDACRDASKRCVVCNDDLQESSTLVFSINILLQNVCDKWREIHRDNNLVRATSSFDSRYYLRSTKARLLWKQKPRSSMTNKKALKRLARKPTTKYNFISLQNSNAFIKDWEIELIFEKIKTSDLECVLCSRLLFMPVTTKCGHTFCKDCLARVVDHNLACPLCMAAISPFEETRGMTVVLDDAAKFLFPREYDERLRQSTDESKHSTNRVPVFVCTNAFPGVACPLYVYEPRYRLLARRCLQSASRRFAMAARPEAQSGAERFSPFGTILEIRDAVHLPDGTSILTTAGVRRFKVVKRGELDGYDTASVQYIRDSLVSAERLPDLVLLHERVYNKAIRWVQSLTPKVLAEVESCIGEMPQLEDRWYDLPDGPSWAWWLMPILPFSSKLQAIFLRTTDLEKRLKALERLLEHIKIKKLDTLNNRRGTLQYTNSDDSDSCRLSSWLM